MTKLLNNQPYKLLLLLYVISISIILLNGKFEFALLSIGIASIFFILILITDKYCKTHIKQPKYGRDKSISIQIGIILVIIILTGIRGSNLNGLSNIELPLLNHLELKVGYEYINPIIYGILPMALLSFFTNPKFLGFEKGDHIKRTAAIWCSIPLVLILYTISSGLISIKDQLSLMLSHTLQNGPFEEFLFRGALQTRLSKVLNDKWGLVISSIIFGIWHIGLGFSQIGTDSLLVALSSNISFQMILGFACGYLFFKTKNIFVPSIFHILFNSIAI